MMSRFLFLLFLIASIFAQHKENIVDQILQKKKLLEEEQIKEFGELFNKINTPRCHFRFYSNISNEIKIVKESSSKLEAILCSLQFSEFDDDFISEFENYLVTLLHSQFAIADEIIIDERYHYEESKYNKDQIEKYNKKTLKIKKKLIELAKIIKKTKGEKKYKLSPKFRRMYLWYNISKRYLIENEERFANNMQWLDSASHFLFLLVRCSEQLQLLKILLHKPESKEYLLKHVDLSLLYTKEMIKDSSFPNSQ